MSLYSVLVASLEAVTDAFLGISGNFSEQLFLKKPLDVSDEVKVLVLNSTLLVSKSFMVH